MPVPTLLIVRDGWGKNPNPSHDAFNSVKLASHEVQDMLLATYPNTLVHTSGFDVGLPDGTMGNSEVGHQNMGAGRIVDQESVKISKEILSRDFFGNPTLIASVEHAKTSGGDLQIFGIVSDAGVHGLLDHLYAVLELAKQRGLARVFLHAFTDGRDTPPNSGEGYIRQVESKMAETGVGKIASVSGRYYAMDRDNRWARVEKAYRVLTGQQSPTASSATRAVTSYYAHPTEPNMSGDEFVTPTLIVGFDGKPLSVVKNGDSVLFYNYRGDRPREITKAFVDPAFSGFDRGPKLDLLFTTLTAYEEGLPVRVAYPKPPKMANILGEYLSKLGKKQFRCAETEKFPHVTFFFNGGRDAPYDGEDRHMCPSPKVSTYDQQPEMAAHEITAATLAAIASGKYDLLVVNFANCDMVGHTGVLPAATLAVQHTDKCVGQLLTAILATGGNAVVLADHGNAEQMKDPATGQPHTAHTTYDVELFVVDTRFKGQKLRPGGRLADVAPTVLQLMGIPQPPEMTGKSLLSL